MTEKKTKLTISGNTKKSFGNTNIPKVKGKNTFVVDIEVDWSQVPQEGINPNL